MILTAAQKFKDSLPKPLGAATSSALSVYGLGESPTLSISLGALAGVASYFWPEETKVACTALAAISTASVMRKYYPESQRSEPIIAGAIVALGVNSLLSKRYHPLDHTVIGNLDEETLRRLHDARPIGEGVLDRPDVIVCAFGNAQLPNRDPVLSIGINPFTPNGPITIDPFTRVSALGEEDSIFVVRVPLPRVETGVEAPLRTEEGLRIAPPPGYAHSATATST